MRWQAETGEEGERLTSRPARAAGGGGLGVRTATFVAGAARPRQLTAPGLPEVALAGRSNVGKSSLLNRLTGRQALARVSKTPGRTQQINFFLINETWVLVDLPGYGFARVPRHVQDQWRVLVEAYLERRATLRGVVLIVDVRRGMEPDDTLLVEFLRRRHVPVQLAVTKIDKLGRGERTRRLRQLAADHPDLNPIGCSSVSGEGIADLGHAITGWLRSSSKGPVTNKAKSRAANLDPSRLTPHPLRS